jgi:hypothetical protein
MIQEFEKLHNLLNIPPGYDLKNTCGFSYNAKDRFRDVLEVLNNKPQLKGIGYEEPLKYSTDDQTLEILFNNIQNPKLLYETYYCYNNLEEEDVGWLTEEQLYIWDHTSEKKVLFKYEGYDNGCHSYFDYSIYLLTFNEIVEKINKNTDYKLKYGNDEDKEKIINRKKIIIQNLYNKSNAAEEFEY